MRHDVDDCAKQFDRSRDNSAGLLLPWNFLDLGHERLTHPCSKSFYGKAPQPLCRESRYRSRFT
jgi:hypothetical protein